MTPLVGLLIAVVAALLAPSLRGLVISVLVAMAAATAVQTWDLGSGLGSNPPDTIDQASYWVVQLIIISLVTAVAEAIYQFRVRRAARRGDSPARPRFSGRRGAAVLVWSVCAMTGGLIAGALLISHLTSHHGQGSGDIPWTGVLGMACGLVALLVAGAALRVGSRREPSSTDVQVM